MMKTDSFVRALLANSLVEDVNFRQDGYDIQAKGKIVSVRLDGKGRALIWKNGQEGCYEIESGRLDDILHRYIVRSCLGVQSGLGVDKAEHKDVMFIPSKIVNSHVVFKDAQGREFVVSGASQDAILSYYKDAEAVHADDILLLLSGFQLSNRQLLSNKEHYDGDREVEARLLKSSVSPDDWSVAPKSDEMCDVGQKIVGNFLCSSADKLNQMTFEEDVSKVFSDFRQSKKGVTVTEVRSNNVFATRAKITIQSSVKSKDAVKSYLDAKYPDGLSVRAVESAMAYEAPSIFKAAGINEPLAYNDLYKKMLGSSKTVTFRLDSNKSLFSALETPGESVAKFRAVPELEVIRNALFREGHDLSELESGLTFRSDDEVIGSIVSACQNFVPVSEKCVNQANTVRKLVGSECQKEMLKFGIDDKTGVFSHVTKIIVN